MPAPFSQTLRSLREDRTVARTALLLVAAGVLVPWAAWGVRGELTLRETSVSGRVEVERAATTVGAPREGKVLTVRAVLGADVTEGDVLVELDPTSLRIQIDAARARLATIAPRVQAIRREIDTERAADATASVAAVKSADEVRARADEARVQQDLTAHQATLAESLVAQKALPAEQARESRAKADAAKARVRSLEVEVLKLESESEVSKADRATRVSRLEREIADLEAQAASEQSGVVRLERELAEFVVPAPISGRIGEMAPIRAGSVVEFADRLCVIVPRGAPRIVASFPLRTAGRVRTGQPARLRFEGFAWTRFGTLGARVGVIGTPQDDGTFRAELTVDPDQATTIPLGHGLACTAEVEVERVTPLELALRSAGRLLDGTRDHASGDAAPAGADSR